MNIYEKIAKIRSEIVALQKNAKGFGYDYVNEEAVLLKINELMEKYNVDCLPELIHGSEQYNTVTVVNKQGKETQEYFVSAQMTYHWINLDDTSDKYDCDWLMVGQQSDPSQAFGSALTYCNRYYFLKFFKVATTKDDPDKIRSEQTAEGKKSQIIIQEITDFIKSKSPNAEQKTALAEAIIAISGDKDYRKITEYDTAVKVLQSIKSTLK